MLSLHIFKAMTKYILAFTLFFVSLFQNLSLIYNRSPQQFFWIFLPQLFVYESFTCLIQQIYIENDFRFPCYRSPFFHIVSLLQYKFYADLKYQYAWYILYTVCIYIYILILNKTTLYYYRSITIINTMMLWIL